MGDTSDAWIVLIYQDAKHQSDGVCFFKCNLHLKRCGLCIAVGSGTEQSYEETIWQKTQESPVSIPLHHRSTDTHQCSHFLPLTRSLRHSTNCILCLSIKICFPFLFFLCLLPPSINSPVAQKLFVTLSACDEGWFVEMNSIWIELDHKCWPGSVKPLGILHNAL